MNPTDLGLAPLELPDGTQIWIRKASLADQATAVRPMTSTLAAMAAGQNVTFGPGEVPPPAHPEEEEPRRWAYPPGFNLPRSPRQSEPITFEMLRALAGNYDVLRLAIEHRKNEMRGLAYVIQPKPVPGQERKEAKARSDELADQVTEATAFFDLPNGEDFWAIWLTQWLEDLFVVDAPTIYLRPRRDGGLFSADVIDGTTIRPLIDGLGRAPKPPDAAYAQVLFGQTWGVYTSDELLYTPYWQRTDSPYGHPPAEWILMAITRALRRQSIDLSQYTEGTLPVAFYRVPEGWQGAQIQELQTIFDNLLAGNDILRSRVRFVPGGKGAGLDQVHPEPKTEVEEWLLYLTCAATGVQPTDIGFQPRGSGLGGKGFTETQQDSTTQRVTKPLANHVKGVCDRILAIGLGMPELELVFPSLEKAEDIVKRAQADEIYLRTGKVSVDELRDRDDEDPIGLGPYVMGTPTLVDDVLDPPDPVVPVDPATGAPMQMPFGMTKPGAKPPPEEPPDEKVAKIAGGVDLQDVVADLDAWNRKARRALKSGRSAAVPFASEVIPDPVLAKVAAGLRGAGDAAAVRAVFELAKAGASASPFESSGSAPSRISGEGGSPTSGADSWSGSGSERPRYP